MIKAVLFDLDGTLADTAPDLGYALNEMRRTRGLPPVPDSATRPVASSGARGLLHVGFSVGPGHPDYRAMRDEFLEIYAEHICRESRLFAGIPELLDSLESRALCWGIVTNKAERLARVLLDRLRIATRAACIIGGDSTPNLKPHPDPLFAACKTIGGVADACVYIGDDLRDIQAGQAAGMKTAAATWGYLNGQAPESWNANWLLHRPQDLLPLL
jgi:phosphoglycolate phosphatase